MLCVFGAVAISELIGILGMNIRLEATLKISLSILLYVVFLFIFAQIKLPIKSICGVIKTEAEKYNLKKEKEQKNAAVRDNITTTEENFGAVFEN